MQAYHTTGNILQRIARLPLRVFFSIFLRMESRGVDSVEKLGTNAVFVANHPTEFDPLIIVSCLPLFSRHLPLIFVSREKSFYEDLGWRGRMYGGLFFKLMGSLQAYTGLNDYRSALKHHLDALERGRNVCIFPLGKRHLDEEIYQARGGAAYLAHQSGLPVIPIRITGIENMGNGDLLKRKRILRVTFGEPIYFKNVFKEGEIEHNKKTYEEFSVSILKKIISLDSGDSGDRFKTSDKHD